MKFESMVSSGNRLQLFKEINQEAENILDILRNLEKNCEKELLI